MICGATGSLAVLVPETVQQEHGKVHLFYAAAWLDRHQKMVSLRKKTRDLLLICPQKSDVCCEGIENSHRNQVFKGSLFIIIVFRLLTLRYSNNSPAGTSSMFDHICQERWVI